MSTVAVNRHGHELVLPITCECLAPRISGVAQQNEAASAASAG
jgi:hypothetical protein